MKTKSTYRPLVFGIAAVLALLFACVSPVKAQKSNQTDSYVFNFKAEEQSWTVPPGVSSIHIDAFGAQGGSANGGKGGRVQSDLKVTAGTKLIIYVGSQPGGAEGGYNGGGKGCGNGYGGGGATDIRIGGSGLDARILVAGGGGGGGYGGFGGAGGGTVAGDGKYDDDPKNETQIAKGGNQEGGGKGARAYLSEAGKKGVGGDGLDNHGVCSNGAMGGGGGGYFGGGGSGAGGGGGGSSYASQINSKVSHEQGVGEGNGKLIIHWYKD
jgi:hypothetical protein